MKTNVFFRLICVLIIYIMGTSMVQTQTLTYPVYQKTYGSGVGKSIIKVDDATDGTFFVVSGQINGNLFLLKTDENGVTQNTKRATSVAGVINGSAKMPNGNIAFIGSTSSCGGIKKMFFFVCDKNLNLIMQPKLFSSNSSYSRTEGLALENSYDGGLMLVGTTGDFGTPLPASFIVKIDSTFNFEWAEIFSWTGTEQSFTSIKKTSDSNYILTNCGSRGAGMVDFGLIKMNPCGDILFSKSYGGFETEVAYSVIEAQDSSIILAGVTKSFPVSNGGNIFVLKTNKYGDTLWARVLYNFLPRVAYALTETTNGKLVISSYNGGEGSLLTQIDPFYGNIEWSKKFGGGFSPNYFVAENNNGFFTGGSLNNSFSVIKTDQNGVSGCEETEELLSSTVQVEVNNFLLTRTFVVPVVETFNLSFGNWNTQSIICSSIITNIGDGVDGDGVKIYPNPAADHITVTGMEKTDFFIFNSFGELVLQKKINENEIIHFDLPSGVYFYTSGQNSGKFIVL